MNGFVPGLFDRLPSNGGTIAFYAVLQAPSQHYSINRSARGATA